MSTVFVWATGQDDNLGDSALRRGYLNALRRRGALVIWRGRASAGFISGLGLQIGDSHSGSYFRWYVSALLRAAYSKTEVAVNAGEVPVSRRGALRMATLTPLILICRLRGGGGLWYGAAVPNPLSNNGFAVPYRIVASICNVVRVREASSCLVLGERKLMPDWAFGLGTPTEDWRPIAERPLITLLLRGDRAKPTVEWLTWFDKLAVELDLTPTVVVQVGRDYLLAQELSDRHAPAEYTAWFVDQHSEQESTVRDVYSRSAVVVSDRLHALIFAASEGAVPLGWVESSRGKVASHFDAVGMDWVGRYEGKTPDSLPILNRSQLDDLLIQLGDRITVARHELCMLIDDLALG
ncbi:polysaccharide pyruvyl transferase family protein [Rhodococcus sp. IEGM 1379]|uniref:polysaccharide pyruvyl transferase family protein n=1 Tax=Rhodococcus sp. IEGM 1379 TaxID=3047086 RepID=UPI0024B64273|nr:polysaccharide pyruvyl transferase family protein [Rhodococcus sp. IEGM 1379]MDI9915076.1 polysaccharide pyruvyl transferase family protein [Rhodococcus sp. IEGM 1379]